MPTLNEPVYGAVKCSACGADGLPVVQRGDKLIARHACQGLPERDVFETDAPDAPEPPNPAEPEKE